MDWKQALSVIVQAYWFPLLLILLGLAVELRALTSRRAFMPWWAVSDQWKNENVDQDNIAQIRKLIEDSFDPASLRRFCQDRPGFRPVLDRVPAEPSLQQVTDTLIDHCLKRIEFDQLLSGIRQENPRQYERYLERISTGDKASGSAMPLSWSDVPGLFRWFRPGAIAAGVVSLLIGLAWILLTSVSFAPPATLISLSYMAEDWDPRLVDLRTATSSGIPVSSRQSLRFFDLWISVPEDAPDCQVKAAVYAGDQRIGSTMPIPLIADKDHPGTAKLREVTIERFDHDTVRNAWRVQPAWTDLDVVLIVERDGKAIGSTKTRIHLSTNGEAWIIGPPNAHFASIVYAVNDGPMLVMDMRDAGETGLGLKPGDKLTLFEIWYGANLDGGNRYTVKAEAYLTADGYDTATLQVSKPNVIQQGVHKLLDYTPFDWTIPGDKQSLILTLSRSDKTVMDRASIPLGRQGSSGLVSRSGCPSASLISLSFKVQEYVDPRLVDLRTASTSGIPAQTGQALQLLDLWAWVPPGAPGDRLQVEVYANGQQIGYTPGAHLVAGAMGLGDVRISGFQHATYANGWEVQEDWADLVIFLVTYDQGRKVGLTATTIRLNPQGTAWLVDPPNLSFASIVYSINDGPPLVWDLRNTGQVGLGARQGDILTVREVWYRSNANSTEYRVMAEGYLSSATGASSQHKESSPSAIQWGISRLPEISRLSWMLPADEEALVLALWRMGPDHNVVMDGVGLPFSSQGSPGLMPASGAILDYQYSTFLDFEDNADLADWSGNVSRSTEYVFAGDYSLQASFAVPETSDGEDLAAWEHDFTADAILAQYYLPEAPNVHVRWMLFCIPLGGWACTDSLELEQGVWHTAVLDLSKTQYRGKGFNEVNLPSLVIRGAITTSVVTEPVSYSIYLDNLHILEDGEP